MDPQFSMHSGPSSFAVHLEGSAISTFLDQVVVSHVRDRWCTLLLGRWIVGMMLVTFHQPMNPIFRNSIAISILPYRFSPLFNQRIGEASNPGPKEPAHTVTFLVTNPTAVHQKTQTLVDFEADILLLSETSATQRAQHQSTSEFRTHGYNTIWGQPAPRQQKREALDDGLRGAPTGVSMHSKFPIRSSNLSKDSDWYFSGRLLHGFIQIGLFTIQLVVLYGLPSCHAGSKADTNDLLQEAIDCVRQSNYPWIIAGDLNHPPDSLSAFEHVRDQGSTTVAHLYKLAEGVEIPPTFKTSTRNDVAILAPELVGKVQRVWVDQQQWLPGHNPLMFCMTVPGEAPTIQYWPLPQSWLPLDLDANQLQEEYAANSMVSCGEEPLRQWSKAVEHAVDRVMQRRHDQAPDRFPQKSLPKKCHGRCREFKVKSTPVTRLITPGWNGHYTPSVDQPTLQIRQQTRQLRRVQSLQARLKKVDRSKHHDELAQEWQAILRADGFRMQFGKWLLQNHPGVLIPPILPSISYLDLVHDLLQAEVQNTVARHVVKRKQYVKFMQQQDLTKYHKTQAFSHLREPSPGLLTQVTTEVPFSFRRISESQHGICQLELATATGFDPSQPFRFKDDPAQGLNVVLQLQGCHLEATLHDAEREVPEQGHVIQSRTCMSPAEVTEQLESYWNGFWQRDSVDSLHSDADWSLFLHLLDKMEPAEPLAVDLLDISQWKNAIKALRSGTARGACGWHADEIKQLPDKAIEDLAKVFDHELSSQLPAHLMRARVIPLKKSPHADSAKQTRPIIILSLIYRLWSRVTTRCILLAWSQVFPSSITGFLPYRSVQHFQYSFQYMLERAHINHDSAEYGGLTIDLTKAFNSLPRRPCQLLLLKLGVPEPLVTMWFQSLNLLQRHWQIGNTLNATPSVTTGAPEGDSWSVCCMLAINKLLCDLFRDISISPHLYADNWSYWTEDPSQHAPAITCLREISTALKLTIDWSKSWCWSTSQAHRTSFQEATSELPELPQIPEVTKAKDLGFTLHYRCRQYRQPQRERHQLTLARLSKLQRSELDLHTKGHLIQSSCLPKALHGLCLYAAGETWFKELRSAISHALVGQHKNSQPYLASAILTPALLDPEWYVIRQSILAARDFLHRSSPDLVHSFLFDASQLHRNPGQIVGPAQALSFYLSKISWKVTSTGHLQTEEFFDLHIMQSAVHDILSALEFSWMQHISIQISSRQGMRHSPCIDRTSTVQILHQQPLTSQHALAVQMVGAWMHNRQKAHFAEHVDGACHFCGMEDSVQHQVVECPTTAVVRAQHPQAVTFLVDHDPIYIHLPVTFHDPHLNSSGVSSTPCQGQKLSLIFSRAVFSPMEHVFTPRTVNTALRVMLS